MNIFINSVDEYELRYLKWLFPLRDEYKALIDAAIQEDNQEAIGMQYEYQPSLTADEVLEIRGKNYTKIITYYALFDALQLQAIQFVSKRKHTRVIFQSDNKMDEAYYAFHENLDSQFPNNDIIDSMNQELIDKETIKNFGTSYIELQKNLDFRKLNKDDGSQFSDLELDSFVGVQTLETEALNEAIKNSEGVLRIEFETQTDVDTVLKANRFLFMLRDK